MKTNPFRNMRQTFDLLPDEMKDRFLDAVAVDVSDLQHNGNPLSHEPATTQEEAIAYVETFDGVGMTNARYAVPEYLEILAKAFDLIPEGYEEEETTFAGERVSLGLYLDFPGGPYLDTAFCFLLNEDDENETVLTFMHSFRDVRLIAETKVGE